MRKICARYSLGILLYLFIFIFFGCTSVLLTDTADYGTFLDRKYRLNIVEGFYPENLEQMQEVKQYSFVYDSGLLDDEAQVVLDCVYSAEQYTVEIERIKALDYSYSYYPADENSRFSYPAYAMSVNENYYEYVLLVEEEYRMIYIHLERYPSEAVTFDKAFLPKDYAW